MKRNAVHAFTVLVLTLLLAAPVAQAGATDPSMPGWALPLSGKRIFGVVTTRKIVALTIDDIRTSRTDALTDELVRNNLKATLFCVSSELATAEAQYAAAAGLEIADHGWTHVALGGMTSQEESAALESSAARLNDMVGRWPMWYRSPYLEIGTDSVKLTNLHEMLYADVGYNPHDYLVGMTPSRIASSVMAGVRPGVVIDLHETTATIAALPLIARALHYRGYECMTMSELATVAPPATSVASLWKAPIAPSVPTATGRPSTKSGTELRGRLTPGTSMKVCVQVQRFNKNHKYVSYRKYTVTTSSAGYWGLKAKLPRGSYRARSSVATSTMYRAALSGWRKMWVY